MSNGSPVASAYCISAIVLGVATHALTHGASLGDLGSTIHPYPTQAEAIRQVGDMFNRTRLTPRVKKIFAAWLRWTG